MATAKAYGSITIVDIGDLGTLSVYPESNQPSSMIYDPNQNGGTYSPDWTTTNLQLTPIIYYGGKQLNAADSGVSVEWTRKVGSNAENSIDAANGESMDAASKVLTVNKNTLNPSGSTIITYVCKVTYKEPQTQTNLTAEGRISFSLIVQPTNIKSCSIIGESVFLYDSSQQLVGAKEIQLTAKLDNCSIEAWQYKDSNGNWVSIEGETGVTLTIKADNATYFQSDIATIRLQTNVEGLYDLHTITKVRDGASGDSVIVAVLSNEDQMIAFNAEGEAIDGAYDQATTTLTVYEGNTDVTSEATITASASGVEGEWNNPTYTVSALNAQTGTVTFTIQYGGKTLSKVFSLVKIQAGADGITPTIYSLSVNSLVVNKTISNVYTPATITAQAYQQTGNNKTAYNGRYKIYVNDSDTPSYTSASEELSATYTPSGSVSKVRFELYAAGGTSTLLDTQTVIITSDGATGADGAGGISFVLGNYSDVIPCNTDGTAKATTIINIPFTAFKGTARIACTASVTTALENGVTLSTNTDGTADAAGLLKITIPANSIISSGNSGNFNITLTADSQTSEQIYTWTKNIQAESGVDAVILQAYAPYGDIINNGENSVTLSAKLISGTSVVNSDVSYQWYVFKSNSYQAITAENTYGGHTGCYTATLTVPAGAVDAYASYRVDAVYNDNTYQAYISVRDKTDPLQVEIVSTLGDKITNSVGIGCIYPKVYRNGDEIDALQNLKVSTTAPTSSVDGDIWAHIDSSVSAIILKKYFDGAWTAYTPEYTCAYKWTFGDYDGNVTDLRGSTEIIDRFLYISGEDINKKMQFHLEVTKA